MASTIELPHKAYLLPTPIADWPPVWWFWLIVGALVILVITLLVWGWSRHYARQYRREAIALITQSYKESDNDQAFIQCCLETIKRCLQTVGNEAMVSLPTAQLLPLLDADRRQTDPHLTPLTELFTERLYQAQGTLSESERRQLWQATATWIRKHHV